MLLWLVELADTVQVFNLFRYITSAGDHFAPSAVVSAVPLVSRTYGRSRSHDLTVIDLTVGATVAAIAAALSWNGGKRSSVVSGVAGITLPRLKTESARHCRGQ
jgi:hypothetical protein